MRTTDGDVHRLLEGNKVADTRHLNGLATSNSLLSNAGAENPGGMRRRRLTDCPDDRLYSYLAFTPESEWLVWHFSFFAAKGHLEETLITGHELFLAHFIDEHAMNTAAFTPELFDSYGRSYASRSRCMHLLNITVLLTKRRGETSPWPLKS